MAVLGSEGLTELITLIKSKFADYLPLSGGTVTGNLTVNGTLTGTLTGNATSATTATSATSATQDGSGNTITSTYLKGLSVSDDTITYTKGNDSTGTITVNNVANATSATSATNDGNGNAIASTYLPLAGGTMTGAINMPAGVVTGSSTNDDFSVGYNWTNRDGAIFVARGVNHASYPGEFHIFARDASNSCGLAGRPDGTLEWDNYDITPQTMGSVTTSSSVSMASSTATTVVQVTLSAGTWLLQCGLFYSSNSTGYREVMVSTSDGGSGITTMDNVRTTAYNGAGMYIPLASIVSCSSSTTFYLVGRQGSGSTLSVSGGIKYFRLSSAY